MILENNLNSASLYLITTFRHFWCYSLNLRKPNLIFGELQKKKIKTVGNSFSCDPRGKYSNPFSEYLSHHWINLYVWLLAKEKFLWFVCQRKKNWGPLSPSFIFLINTWIRPGCTKVFYAVNIKTMIIYTYTYLPIINYWFL